MIDVMSDEIPHCVLGYVIIIDNITLLAIRKAKAFLCSAEQWLLKGRLINIYTPYPMQDIFPKVNQVFSYHLKNFDVINTIMSSISLRVEAEEQYEKAINKSFQKISEIQSDHPLYSKITHSFKGLISERIHQVRFFKEQIAKEADVLKNALSPIEQTMKSHLSELKTMEKELRTAFDSLTKSRSNVDSKYKELDQKFILNEVSAMYKMNKNMRKTSEAVIKEQQDLLKSLEQDSQKFKDSLTRFETGAQQRQRKIWQLDIKVEEQFVDFFKKLNVHEISLIRNIQYDIDSMIKKTDIFNWQNTNEFKDRFNLRGNEQLQSTYHDPYASFKLSLLKDEEIVGSKVEQAVDQDRFCMLKEKLSEKKDADQLFQDIRMNYYHYRREIFEFIESFRKAGQFKFQADSFKHYVFIFKQILKVATHEIDFECIYKVILYCNSYYCPNYANSKKRTILQEIRQEKLFGDITFWKFYLLFHIKSAIVNAQAQKEEKEIHIRNSVYSVLLSNSLTMVESGLEKHHIKNLIGKLAKTFASLSEAQVAELLKVIETAYENLQKLKKGK